MSSLLNLPHDQAKFLAAQIISFGSGCWFRVYLEPNSANVTKRHLISSILGISLSLFCFGIETINLVIATLVSFLFIKILPRNYVQLVTFVFLMTYLSGVHIYYQVYHYAEKVFDISSPMMILTQKLTLLAFSYYDGMQPDDKLNPDQKSQAIKESPTLLEFLGYSFNFQSILVGPTCLYKDYINFITGENYLKYQNVKSNGNSHNSSESHSKIAQPSNLEPVLRKLIYVLVLTIIYLKMTPLFPYYLNNSPEMYTEPFWFRVIYLYVSAACHRCKYYLAWVIADMVSNASGLGFNGYDEKGKAKWDLVTGVNIIALETSTSVKYFLDNWNITTQTWLRRIAYDRLKTGTGKTLGVFILSAFWHGFYPGYYFTFIQIAFTVYGGRKVRKILRPYFQTNKSTINLYGLIGWINTLFIICYASASFNLLEFWPCVQFYNSFYWIGHIVTASLIVILPLTSLNINAKKKKT